MQYPDISEMNIPTKPGTVGEIAETVFSRANILMDMDKEVVPVIHIVGKDMTVLPTMVGPDMSPEDIKEFMASQATESTSAIIYTFTAMVEQKESQEEAQAEAMSGVSLKDGEPALLTVCFHPEGTDYRMMRFSGTGSDRRVTMSSPWTKVDNTGGPLFSNPYLV